MTPYCDFGFLSVLLVRSPGTFEAWRVIRHFEAPFSINDLHLLQLTNLFTRCNLSGTPRQKLQIAVAQRLWQTYLDESVFVARRPDWDGAYRIAVSLTKSAEAPVPPPTIFLHAALAAIGGATHVLSFDPRTRKAAYALGLAVLPHAL